FRSALNSGARPLNTLAMQPSVVVFMVEWYVNHVRLGRMAAVDAFRPVVATP
ncbi:hypothetical protein LCGC14_3154700, partial [marine sediment metagenome]